ncbi:geranylgeranylglycerol-phosphate geranylgeranyltransferase [Hymenobacter taeanensis]|uniref:Geranylgeranylglycerol-phosphate geranylgeranyltransferase n=1 Tax=Hymenobacter taeanensis TaxID=2735321 RepID=A0A6M6BGU0_9BACT|nr:MULTISPECIES: geranylgeranylglycerol-phosphate geranylgeranyltransferase [Hymenobacter]QJX47249.1 geranylgeranylglycerol-phosphate geranylgeranyltransferase [Hymenobacter taeanensis]UOQ79415.1 geranylgeranylglycerol-phosphate geranylgeranyltransferase [Hymenobacter sp. 5414T-23]
MAAPRFTRSNQPATADPGPWRQLALLVRLPNLLIMALCLLLVRKALLLPRAPWAEVLTPSFALLALAALSIAAAGYIINDYYDVKIDAINRPDRLVVGKVVNRRHAMVGHLLLSGLGVLVSGALSPLLGLVNLGSALLLWGYSVRFKRVALVGNVSIAMLTAALVLLPELQLRIGTKPVWLYALAAFLLTVVREIVKDIEDMRGDAEHDCRTLPIVVGVPKTKWVVAFFLACLAVLVLGVEKVLLETGQWGLGLWLFALVLLPLGWLAIQLRRADRRQHFAQLSTACKVVMLAGVLSMLLAG